MSIRPSGATILVLAPHTDDGELGAGGSIARWADEGNDVHYVAFSACETVQPATRPSDTLRHECAKATSILGVPTDNLIILDFEVRQFTRDRQEILDAMTRLNTSLTPDLVLVPSLDDTHQDHHVVAQEACRAFKRTRMLGYEAPWNNFTFDVTAFVTLEGAHIQRKWEALRAFESQAERAYMSRAYVEAQTVFRGVQAGVAYAEAYQMLRWYI